MEKKINIAGLHLDNCTVRESMMMFEKALAERTFFSISEVDTDMILMTGMDERVRESINLLNHTILSDEAILKAAGQKSQQRQHEIADRIFFREVMRKLEQEQLPICLLGDNETHTLAVRELLLQQFPHINITDMEILDECTGEVDNLINEINAKTQDVVISILPPPLQEIFFLKYREKLSVTLWYGIGSIKPEEHRNRMLEFFREQRHMHALTKFMAAAAKK